MTQQAAHLAVGVVLRVASAGRDSPLEPVEGLAGEVPGVVFAGEEPGEDDAFDVAVAVQFAPVAATAVAELVPEKAGDTLLDADFEVADGCQVASTSQ